ncbi:FG-GAP repeat protein, partial [Thiorhodococcus drewsii AZ1]
TLSGADKTDVDALLNANGTQSSDSITYNLAVADDWNGPITGGDISDLTGNGITVSGISAVPTLSYSTDTFVEDAANDGTISTAITITLSDDTFAADLSDKIVATNVPAGLSASFARTSDTVVTATLTGSATAHANADDIADLSFTFQDGAFVNTATASDVTGYAKSDLGIDFSDPAPALPSFQTPVTNPFGLSAMDYLATPTFADLDGDGDLDALIGNQDGHSFYFENTGSATSPAFANAQTDPFGLSNVGKRAIPALADLDGDGDLDALIGNKDGNSLYFENTGSPSSAAFANAQTDPFGLSVEYPFRYVSPTLADLDGDGDLDALIGNRDGNSLYFENTGSPSSPAFASAQVNPFGLSGVGPRSSPTLADLDGDGDLDALIGNDPGNILFFLNGTPPGVTVAQTDGDTSVTEGGATDTYTLVLDSQPTADVVITLDTTNDQVSVDTPTLTFTNANWNTPQTVTVSAVDDSVGEGPHFGVIAHSVSSTDTAYDGLNIDRVSIQIADDDLPSGAPTFQPPLTNPFGLSDVGTFATPTFADLDGDGDLDALIGNNAGQNFYFENTGSTSSAAFASAQTDPFGLSDVGFNASPTLADLDGDGDLDALIGDRYGDSFYFENTGSTSSAAFASSAQTDPFELSDARHVVTPTLADLDGDGDLDALIGEFSGNTFYFENVPSNSAPSITSATYDSSTNVLSVIAANITSGDTIDVSKLTLTGEGGQTYTLTSANVTASSDTAFSVTLNATDQLYVEGLLNQDGTTSAGSSAAFNLAAADDWDTAVTDGDTSITTSTVTVSNTQTPTITSATYDVSTGVLEVTGTNFVHQDGATNDIDLSTLTFTGAGGSSAAFTLTTSSDVEITDATTFSATLSGADKTAVDALLNANGTQSSDSITYNLAVADDWNGPITGGDISDLTGNGITVSGISAVPALSYSTDTFVEDAANDGTISTAITITLSDDTFAADLSDKIVATNVPAGLSASFVRTSDTVVTATLTGSATAHANADDIADLTVTFQDGAFVNTATAADVTGYAKSDLGIDFADPVPIPALTYSTDTFVEAAANDGTISTAITITLSDDTFAADLSDKIVATNVPAGLSASFVRTSDTVVTATLTGSATAHANADDIADLTVTFQDGAFVNTATAADVTGYAKSDLGIDFADPVPIPALTYSTDTFVEAAANDGTIS